jgi:Ran-binding protein 1
MRCEKTKKVIANHALHSRIELKPYKDKSWIWVCLDVAHGESQQKVFALRFANSEVAGEFKAKFKEYQAKM